MHTIIHPSGADQTTELVQAMGSGGNVVEWVQGCRYLMTALRPAPGTRFLGFGGTGYTEPAPYHTPCIHPSPGAACVFDFSQAPRSVTMEGFTIDGLGQDVTAISGG